MSWGLCSRFSSGYISRFLPCCPSSSRCPCNRRDIPGDPLFSLLLPASSEGCQLRMRDSRCRSPVSSVSREELWGFPLRYLLGGLPEGGTRLSCMGWSRLVSSFWSGAWLETWTSCHLKWKAETLARSFALASSNANLSPHFAHIKSKHQLNPEFFLPNDSHLSDPISISEVHDALRRCGNSYPGPDGIHYQMLRRLSLLSLEGILALFNQSWSSGVVPHSWRRAIVVPILKKGKPPSQPSSYRPISLTSTLCKLLERVIATRLRWFMESKNMLNQYQAGFRKGRGCVDHIVRLTQDIAASSTKKQMTLGVFLDLEKAFDMVWREGIIEQLSKMGVKGKPLEWIHNFLQDRSIQVRVGSALSEPLVVENGTPQGSVLSPLLFIIMMNAIPNPCKGVELSTYADDIALWTTGTSARAMTTRMQKQLNTAKFLFANGFKISASKSQAVLFTNSRVKWARPTLDFASERFKSHCPQRPPS